MILLASFNCLRVPFENPIVCVALCDQVVDEVELSGGWWSLDGARGIV